MPNIGLKDVSWFSEGEQHPFFISFLKGAHPNDEEYLIKFPSLHYVTTYKPEEMQKPHSISFPEGTIAEDGLIINDKEFFKSHLVLRREMTREIESELMADKSKTVGVHPHDYSEQEIHWF